MKFGLYILILYQFSLLAYGHIQHKKYRPSKSDSLPGRYIIEFESKSSQLFLQSLEYNQDITVHHVFSHDLFQGASIEIHDLEREDELLMSILDHSDIAVVSSNRLVKPADVTMETAQTYSPDDIKKLLPHGLHQVDRARSELNLTGEGIFVGIIDSGVDYTLPALGGNFGEGFKVSAGYDLVGDDYNGSNTPIPDDDPLDSCSVEQGGGGHGTHVAGIIAGYDPENNFEGVAPNVKLGVWRIFGCTGSASDEITIKAILMARDAGVDVINVSIGSRRPWLDLDDPLIKVYQRVSAEGIHVVLAAGNFGTEGVLTVSSAPTDIVFSVGSSINQYKPVRISFEATGVDSPIYARPLVYNNDKETNFIDGDLIYPQVEIDGVKTVYDFCLEIDSTLPDIQGKIVYQDSTSRCSYNDRLATIKRLGGIGSIMNLEIEGEYRPAMVDHQTLPTVFIPKEDSQRLLKAYQEGPVSIQYRLPDTGVIPNDFAGTMSCFSSEGSTVDLNFDPDITATGENVISTLPRQHGGYAISSGTSMSSPYVAGSLALYLQYHSKSNSTLQLARTKFKNYASLASFLHESSGIIESPIRQGSGLIQVYDAITQTNYVTPPHLTFKDSSFVDEKTQELKITNASPEEVSYRLYNNISIGVSPYDRKVSGYKYIAPSGNIMAEATIETSLRVVKLAPGETQTISIRLTPPKTDPLDHVMYGGFIQFDPISNDQHKTIHIPYFGVAGNQKDIPIIDESTFNVTYYEGEQVIYRTGQVEVPSLHTVFNPTVKTNSDKPFIEVKFNTISPTLSIKAEIMNRSEPLGSIFYATKLETDTRVREFSVGFNGYYCDPIAIDSYKLGLGAILNQSYCSSFVNTGTYSIRISALKMFGQVENQEDWQTWTTIPFEIETINN